MTRVAKAAVCYEVPVCYRMGDVLFVDLARVHVCFPRRPRVYNIIARSMNETGQRPKASICIVDSDFVQITSNKAAVTQRLQTNGRG